MADDNTPVQLAALDQRVTGLEQGIKDVVTAVSILSNEIRQGSKTQWPVIWSAMGVGLTMLGLVGVLVYRPVDTAVTDVKSRLIEMDKEQVPRVEHERIWAYQERISNLNKEIAGLKVNNLEDRVKRMEDEFLRYRLSGGTNGR